jgi:hypothetical protein
MENVTKEPNSEIGSGQKNMDFLGLRALFRWLGGKSQKKTPTETFSIFEDRDGLFFVVQDRGYGHTVAGPYRRKQDAKGVRTRLIKQNA